MDCKKCDSPHNDVEMQQHDSSIAEDFRKSSYTLRQSKMRGDAEHALVPPMHMPKWVWESVGEFLGTLILVFVGTGVVAAAVTTGAQVGLWQVAVVWAIGVTIAIYAVGPISGAHLNPAVTLCLVLFRKADFPLIILVYYWPSQLLGAFFAGMIVFGVFQGPIMELEFRSNITRGAAGSEKSAFMFGEYFPNPGTSLVDSAMPVQTAFGVEVLGTLVIMMVILVLTDKRNQGYRTAIVKGLAPFWIGLTVAAMISILAPLTQGGFNPARDFGPRLVSLIFGWGYIAIPGPRCGFWIYLVGPLVGSVAAGLVHQFTIGRHFEEKCEKGECTCD